MKRYNPGAAATLQMNLGCSGGEAAKLWSPSASCRLIQNGQDCRQGSGWLQLRREGLACGRRREATAASSAAYSVAYLDIRPAAARNSLYYRDQS